MTSVVQSCIEDSTACFEVIGLVGCEPIRLSSTISVSSCLTCSAAGIFVATLLYFIHGLTFDRRTIHICPMKMPRRVRPLADVGEIRENACDVRSYSQG